MYLGECATVDLLRRARDTAPEHKFLVGEDRSLTYGETFELVSRLATGFERMGVSRGDRVLLALNTSTHYPVVMLALHALGAMSVNVNPEYSPDEFRHVISDADPKLIVTETAVGSALGNAAGKRPVIHIDVAQSTPAYLGWDELIGAEPAPELKRPEVCAEDAATVLYTSGTTSRPKGVVFSQGSHGFAGEYLTRNLGVRREDIYLCVLPFFHSNALQNNLFPILTVQGTLVLRKFSATRFAADVLSSGATLTAAGVSHWRLVLAKAAAGGIVRYEQSNLRIALSGGPMKDEEYAAFEALFGCRFVEIFGMTEGVVPCTIHPPHALVRKRRSGGPPGLGSEVRIVLPDGSLAGRNEVGEIEFHIHGRGARMLGYLNDAEQSAALFTPDGWIRSGDAGYLDEDGWLFFVERFKNMLKVGGENVAASEVERVLTEHPAVEEAVVVGIADAILGQVVGAFVVLNAGQMADPRQILEHCAQRLAKFKVPRIVCILDAFPRNPLGKVVKRELPQL
jgi:crotonobetaine/carnitine-CoA ligase